jgi:hypothetical protein
VRIDRKRLAELAAVRVYVDVDSTPVRGNALASGDDPADRECEDSILERLENGDVWAWAYVEVRASYAGVDGADYLGCCSYEDEADFRRPGGYFDDMREEALEQLALELESILEDIGAVLEKEGN